MPEANGPNLAEALWSRARCDCAETAIAILAITEAASESRASIEQAQAELDELIDPTCPGPIERENSREGCLAPRCGHKNGPHYMSEQARDITFISD